jgi:hypothetical protein
MLECGLIGYTDDFIDDALVCMEVEGKARIADYNS